MKDFVKKIDSIDQFPPECLAECLPDFLKKSRSKDNELELDDLIEVIVCYGDREESIESLYVNFTYSYTTKNWLFQAFGSQYRKGDLLCDEENENYITVTDIAAKNKYNEERHDKKKEARIRQWGDLFSRHTKEELLVVLSQIDFPKSIIGKIR